MYEATHSRNNTKVTNFNKFLKGKTLGYLKILKQGKMLSAEEDQALTEYELASCSFESNEKLFQLQSTKAKCLDFYRSSKFIQSLLVSDTGFDRKI